MLHQVIRRAYYLNKHLEAPLLKEREEYLEYLAGKGYYRETLKITAEYLLRITEFLHLEEEGIVTIEDIEKAAAAWAKSKHHHPMKKAFSKSGGKKFILLSIDWLKRINRLGCLPEEQIPLFNQLFERRYALKRHITAPLLQERLLYLQHWDGLKARNGTLRRIAQYQLLIMDLLKFHAVRMISLQEIEDAATKWAENEKVLRRNNTYSKFSKGRFINDATGWFKMLGCLIAELPIKHHGPHALRHACATHLINEGFSLKEISDHLGHQELETTRIYAKVDLINLRKVADQNWEGLL